MKYFCICIFSLFFLLDNTASTIPTINLSERVDTIPPLSYADSLAIQLEMDSFTAGFLQSLDVCYKAFISSSSVVHYNSYCNVQLELNELYSDKLYFFFDTLSIDSTTIDSNRIKLLTGLRKNQVYYFKALNNCGQIEVIGSVSTYPNSVSGVIDVSERVFDLVTERVSNGAPGSSFTTRLQEVPGSLMSTHEKLFVLQEVVGRETPFIDGTAFPPSDPGTNTSWREPCNCNLLRTGSRLAPGNFEETEIVGQFLGGDYGPYSNIGGAQWNSHDIGNADYFVHNYNAGPAKWHQIQSQGWKATKNQYRQAVWGDQSTNRENRFGQSARISLAFLCLDGEKIIDPSGDHPCLCEKPIDIRYTYHTKLDIIANTKDGGGGDKEAYAAVWDAVMVSWLNETTGEYQLLDASAAGISSECSMTIREDFLPDLTALTTSLIETAAAIIRTTQDTTSGIADILETLPEFVTNLIVFLGEPKYERSDCTNGRTLINDFQGSNLTYIRPNQVYTVQLISMDSLVAGGMRSWTSIATIVSAFSLAAHMSSQPAYSWEYQNEQCCSKASISWLYHSIYGAPVDNDDLSRDLADKLALLSLQPETWEFPRGPGDKFIMPSQHGHREENSRVDKCNEDFRVIPNKQQDREPNKKSSETFTRIRVYDMAGRNLQNIDNVRYTKDEFAELSPHMVLGKYHQLSSLQSGIYLFVFSGKYSQEVMKVFLP